MAARINKFRKWTLRLPSSWGLGQAQIHSSLLVTLGLLSVLFYSLSYYRLGFTELRTVAVTLPIIWVVSLVIRIAAQHLAIGDFARDAEMVIGPSGNLKSDYEYLPSRVSFAYSIAGQLASLALISLGLVVGAAMSPAVSQQVAFDALLDLQGGFSSRAWASQIMWVNIFLFGLHLLPTVPFDMRATAFALFNKRNRNAQEPIVFRAIAAFDSHLAALLFGAGLATVAIGYFLNREIVGWYAAIAAAVYLFVASQWETARAEELEEQYVPTPPRLKRIRKETAQLGPHLSFDSSATDEALEDFSADLGLRQDSAHHEPPPGGLEHVDSEDSEVDEPTGRSASHDEDAEAPSIDIDEILRKLHRDGPESLSAIENQALLSASREIKQRRETS